MSTNILPQTQGVVWQKLEFEIAWDEIHKETIEKEYNATDLAAHQHHVGEE